MRKTTLLLIIVLAFGLQGFTQETIPLLLGNDLSETEIGKNDQEAYEDLFKYAKRIREANINPIFQQKDAITEGQLFTINLFKNAIYQAKVSHSNVSGNTFYIVAKVIENPTSLVVISTTENRTLVTVRLPGNNQHFTVIQNPQKNIGYIIEKNLTEIRRDLRERPSTPIRPPDKDIERWSSKDIKRFKRAASKDPDEWADIDVLVVYSEEASNAAGSLPNVADIHNLIVDLFANANDVLNNSETNLNLNVVNKVQVDFDEDIDNDGDANHNGVSDLYGMQNIRELRDQYRADLVVLLVSQGWNCVENDEGQTFCVAGNAYSLKDGSPLPDGSTIDHNIPSDNMGYSVSAISSAYYNVNYTLIHEIGHNLGAGHHKKQDPGAWWNPFDDGSQPGPQLFDYSAGWLYQHPDTDLLGHITVMSYGSPSQYVQDWIPEDIVQLNKQPYFSNPNITHPDTDQPLGYYSSPGHADNADNARTIRETKHIVAAYRPIGIVDFYSDPLIVDEWSNVEVNVTAPRDGEYELRIYNSDGSSAPDWLWFPDYSDPGDDYFATDLIELENREPHTFHFEVKPESSSTTILMKLRRKRIWPINWTTEDSKEITLEASDLEHLEIAFSLDRSGSMNWYGYMQDAKDVSNTFVDLMELGDYLAVTSFASSASVNYPFTELATQQDKDDAKAAINSIHASGGTGMGAGMLAAQQELNKGNTSQKQFMLLLGDGFENSYPYVDDVLPNIPYNTDIYTVALGPESDQTLLNNIAASTGGAYLYSPGTSDLAGSYQDMRTQVTGQQMLAIFGGEITEGETQSHTTPIDGGSQETQFLLTWPGSDMDLTLTDPDGHVIDHNTTDPDITFISGDAHEIYKVKSPIPGDYDIHVEGVSLSGSQNYDVFVTGRSELEMDVAFDKSLYGLNEPILITAGIMDGEIPVTGATVEAEVLLPAKSDFVPKGMYDDEEPLSGKPLVFDEETGNYYDEDGQLRYYKTTLILYDDGQHGDGQADNGVYGNYFTNTGTPGSYSFNVSASGMAPVSGQFTRLRRASTAVTTAQSILVTKPQTGAEWYNNNDHTVKWSSTNISGNVDIFLSVDSGNNFDIPLAEDVPDTGSLEVFIPDVASNTFSRIQVQSIDHPTVTGTNPGNFSILENPDTHDLAPCELTAEADGNSAVLTWKAPGTCEDDDDDNGDDPVQLSEGFEGSLFPPAEWAGLSPQGYVGWIKVGTGTSPVPGWNQGEAIAAPDGEDFMAFATWNTGGSGSTDQWLVTPQVTPEAETVLSFHMRYWPDTYDDQVDILISTTSQTDPAAFTTIIDNLEFTEGSSENWTHYTYQLSNYVAAGTPVYIAFREHVPDNQTMGAAIFLDNVYVGPADKADLMLADSQNQGMSHDNTASDSEIPAKKDSAHNPGLPNTAPVDTGGERGLITSGKNTYTITTHDHHAVRSDDDLPSPDFYRIHRNDTYVANVDGQTLTFTDQGLEEATYAYYITAVYDEPDGVIFSDPSNTAQVTITEGACTPGWEVVGNLEHNMSIVGELIIDGQVSTNENDMVGAFVDGECRGIASPIPEFGGLVFLSVGSNQSSGENVELKIWNSSTCHSCDAVPGFVFESQGELGTADDPYVMECGDDSDEVVQDIDFGEGFNWFSINVATGNMGVNSLLEPLNPCPDDRVIGQQNFALYTGAEWIGSLTELNNKEKFRMKLCSDQTLSITGTAAPLDPMNLNSGFTWISYLPQECIPVNDALDNLVPTPASDSRIIGQETFSLYTGNEWIGSLTHMCPGEGYIIRLSDQSTLTYPESAGKFSGDQPQAKTRKSPTGVYPRENLEHTMMVVATLDKGDPTQAVNPGDVIYAFAGEECRGMASPLPEHNGRIFMSVASDSEQHEQISFKVWLEDKDELVTVNEQIAFVSLQSTGTMDDPLVLTLDHPVDATDLASNGNFIGQAYPNPFTGHTNVPYRISEPADVQVRLYDSLGQLVRTVEENHEQAGEYLLRVERKGLRQGVYFMMIDISTHKESLHKNSKLIIQ